MYFSDARGVLHSASKDGGPNRTDSNSLVAEFQQRVGRKQWIRFVLLQLEFVTIQDLDDRLDDTKRLLVQNKLITQ